MGRWLWGIGGVLLLLGGWLWWFPPETITPPESEARPTDARRDRIVLTGSSTVAPLAAEIGKRFESLHPGIRVDVQTGGSSRGILDARNGLADIGMVSRDLKEQEGDLLAFTIALDGITIIVHKSNPVPKLTREQVIGIYTGKIRNWKMLGGRDAPITVINKAEGRSTLELFREHFGLENTEIRAHVIIGDNEQGIKMVAGNPHAIGYVSIGTATFNAEQGIPIRLIPIDGVEPTLENVRKGLFPIVRPLNLVTTRPPEGRIREFIEFAQSNEVHDLVESQYFVPLQD